MYQTIDAAVEFTINLFSSLSTFFFTGNFFVEWWGWGGCGTLTNIKHGKKKKPKISFYKISKRSESP